MKVILHKLFPYAPYLNEYIGLEDEQRIGETELEGIERLRKLVEQSHRERYPNLYPNGSEAMIESFAPPITQVEKKLGVTVEDINSCPDKIVLQTYQYLIKGKPELEEAYLKKLKQFMQ